MKKWLAIALAAHVALLTALACSGSVEVRGMPKNIELVPGGCDDPPDAGADD